jgi:hypothetical protein
MHTAYSLKPTFTVFFKSIYNDSIANQFHFGLGYVFGAFSPFSGSFTYWNVDNGGHFRVVIS